MAYTKDYFVNPYNFISFPDKKAKKYDDKDEHTGVIEYTVTTKSPIFIPNSSTDKFFEESENHKDRKDHKSYDFFSYTDLSGKEKEERNKYREPVIPGSEMRGVVRSVYEALTDSCMGVLNEDEYPVKRSPAQFNAGLIYRDKDKKYSLIKATTYKLDKNNKSESLKDGDKIFYINKYEWSHERGGKIGYVIKWGMGVNKKNYHVFVSNNQLITKDMSKEDMQLKINTIIDSYLEQPALKDENKKAYENYKEAINKFFTGNSEGYFPVNYSQIKGLLYLAPAVFSKEVSTRNLKQLAGEFAPCEKGDCCPACDLFGYISEDGSKSSKIRFSDLSVILNNTPGMSDEEKIKELFGKKITLQTLGGPKLGNVDFYLKKPEGASFWTYDYYVKNGKIIKEQAKLRGRKFYWHWHSENVSKKSAEPTNLNKTIRPVREGFSFSGKLYFEGISQKQLNQLIWILNCGTEKLGLKIGGAKPLGYGSVSCKVDKVTERVIELNGEEISYETKPVKFEVNYDKVEFSKNVKAEFYAIAGLDSIEKDIEITYPKEISQRGAEIEKGYKWFVNNHGGKMPNRRENAIIKKDLPSILDIKNNKNMLRYSQGGGYNNSKNKNQNNQQKPYNKKRK